MNCRFTLCVLAASFVCLRAAPRLARLDLLRNGGSGKFWSDCTKPSDRGKINSITITPNPPVEGQTLSINANTTIDEEVTGGSVKVSLMYGFLPIYKHTFDLCQLLEKVEKNCPVPKGILDITVNVKVPTDVPGGDYSGKAIATDQNNQEIFCINLNYKF